jgi:translocator protein
MCLVAGAIGSFFTTPAISGWYATLVRPEIAPPNWVFGPVWTTLYVLMGTAFFLIWRKGIQEKRVKVAVFLFIFQLVLNVLWSIVFFRLHSLGGALAEITVLWIMIAATIVSFRRISRLAALLLIPYILWVSFAAYVTYSFWSLN